MLLYTHAWGMMMNKDKLGKIKCDILNLMTVRATGDSSELPRQGAIKASATEQVRGPTGGVSREVLETSLNTGANDWKIAQGLSGLSDTKDVEAKSGDNPHMPETVVVREFSLGGHGGPSFKVAENLGATPIQITTKDSHKLLTSPIDADQYKRELGGAGAVGGIPIVGPAGRTFSKNGKAEILIDDKPVVSFEKELLGKDGRIPLYEDEGMSHGPIFTSQQWKLTKLEQKGPQGANGIRATYTLPLLGEGSDEVVNKLVVAGEGSMPGKMEAVYTLEPDENSEPKFSSEIRVDPGKNNTLYLGALAQHAFLASEEGDQLQTNAKSEYEAPEDKPELPTGKIIDIQDKHNFQEARIIHKDSDTGALETVLTGYDGGISATLIRNNGLKIVSEAGGAYDGFLLCNKGDGNLMLEPIQGAPNAFANGSENPVLLAHGQKARYQYSLSLAA